MADQPNAEQLAAIQRFAATNGFHWRDKLLAHWFNGTDEKLKDGPLLRQVRNQFGPAWLMGMKTNE